MTLKQIEQISKALGDPYRLKIIEAVNNQDGWMQCAVITDMLNLAQSTVSHHLKLLTDANLLIAEKEGRTAKYLVNKEILDMYIEYLSAFNNKSQSVSKASE